MIAPNRPVNDRDFRLPEFRDARPEDYEFRADGKLVRKDRWETGLQSIRFLVGLDGREFEISAVVDRVKKLAESEERWCSLSSTEESDLISDSGLFDVRLSDGSVLRGAAYAKAKKMFCWRAQELPDVRDWRELCVEELDESPPK